MDTNNELDSKINEIKERFEISRANLMTQIFVSLATAHGVGMAAILSMIGQFTSNALLVRYLTVIVLFLGIGLCLIIVSAMYRFEHSKFAEKQKRLELENKLIQEKEMIINDRMLLLRKYKFAMIASVFFLFISIIVGVFGAIHNALVM